MDLDDLLHRYFPGGEPGEAGPDALVAGIDRMQVDLGLETDRGRRFALWSLLHMLGHTADLDATFEDAADRDAARNFMDLADKVEPR